MAFGPAAHLPFGGSTAHRWMRCAGSVKLAATLPPQPENEHMARGTRAHALLERCLKANTPAIVFESENDLDAEDVAAVQIAMDYVHDILRTNEDAIWQVEQRVTLHEDVGGTADVLIYIPSKRHLHVIDYKHGAGHYVTEDAPQFLFYATCALMSMTDLDVGTIYATVIQPRHWRGADNPIRTAVYGPADIIAYSDDVDEAVARAKSPEPTFTAGEWCDWCPAAHICPAIRDSAFKIVTVPEGGSPLPHGDEIVIKLPAPGGCRDPAVLAQTLPALDAIEAWTAAMRDIAYTEAMAGKHIPGHKLVAKRGTRKWIDEQTAKAKLQVDMGLDAEHIYSVQLKSVAQIEKLLKGKPAKDALASLVEKKSSGFNLVPETEPGEAVNPLALLADSNLPPDL